MQHNNLNEISSITRQMPFIYDKFVVDFVNGIQVNQDHIRVQTQRTGFFAQLMDSVKGTGAQRQIEINQNTAQGLTASLQ